MTDPKPTQPDGAEERAMLIERAVRGELSPEEQSRLDELVAADPSVSKELELARREDHDMSTAATLLNEQSDPERMRMAIEQKLKFDRRGLRLVAGGFIAFVVIYALFVGQDRWPWGVLAPISLCIIWWLITEKRLRSFKRGVPHDQEGIAKEFTRHLARSRMALGFNRAIIPIFLLMIILTVVDNMLDGSYARAAFVLPFGFFICVYGWKYLYNSSYQKRYDQFLQGRLTLEELFDKRTDTPESDGE